MKANQKFLLIKTWGWGFWSDMDHVIGMLLAAELTNRIPVVYWGPHSLYSDGLQENAFELYFEPVSEYSVDDVIRPDYSYFPPIWNHQNVLAEDLDKTARLHRSLAELMTSKADVVVSDVHFYSRPLLEYVRKEHWAYGMTGVQIYRQLIKKYIRLKPDIKKEIDDFYNKHLKNEHPILAIHVRASDKVREVENLEWLNEQYEIEISKFLEQYDVKKIFLITDSDAVIEEYEKKYGSIIYTESQRAGKYSPDDAPHLKNFVERRRKGIEVIMDTYLSSRCDYFIGNGYSNVSFFVNRLKDWPEPHIKLFYNRLDDQLKINRNRGIAEWATKWYRSYEHQLEYPKLYQEVDENG